MSDIPPPPNDDSSEEEPDNIPPAPNEDDNDIPIPPSPSAITHIPEILIPKTIEPIPIPFEKCKAFNIRQKINWDEVVNACCSESGSGRDGVCFLQTSNYEVFLLKGTIGVADEIYSSRISRSLGIRTPFCDLIEYRPSRMSKQSNDKYGNDWWAAKVVLKKIGKTYNNSRVISYVERNLVRAYYIIMEFIPGCSMYSKKFDRNYTFTSKKHLNDLGRIFVFDLVQNNSDRFPIPGLFKHEGNAENFMFLKSEVVAIDQTCCIIRKEEDRKKYLNEVQKVVLECNNKGFTKNKYIDYICKFIKDNTLFEITEDGKKEIFCGIQDAFEIIQLGKKINFEMLQKTYDTVRKLLTGDDWDGVYSESLKRIDVKFIGDVLEVIKKNFKKK